MFKILLFSSFCLLLLSCNGKMERKQEILKTPEVIPTASTDNMFDDSRTSLQLNAMQKQHQLKNMRSHLEAVQEIIKLLALEKYDDASIVAELKLGSSTEMKLMCASFNNKEFENLGLAFHKSADSMSEIFKQRNKNKSLQALSTTLNYCTACHSKFKQ